MQTTPVRMMEEEASGPNSHASREILAALKSGASEFDDASWLPNRLDYLQVCGDSKPEPKGNQS